MLKFGGKEYQDEAIGGKKLDWYDFHARNYDAALGRRMNVDPLAEVMPSWSQYTYTFNNPVRYTDPTGMIPCDECPKDAQEEDTYMSKGGGDYYHENGEWVRNDGTLDEVVITTKRSAEIPSSETRQGEAISWNGCDCTLDEWNSLNGTIFTSHQEAYDWHVQNKKQA